MSFVFNLPSSLNDEATVTRKPLFQSISKAQLRNHLAKSKTLIPRYLFRGFHLDSGGHPELHLNTINATTPLAFARGNGPNDIFQLNPNDVLRRSGDHLLADPSSTFETYFSSWTHSISFALLWARGGYLGIIDTQKLPDRNKILFMGDSDLQKVSPIFTANLEFQIYGIVSGDAFKAVCLSGFAHVPMTPASISRTLDISNSFGHPLSLFVAANLLTRRKVSYQKSDILRALLKMPIPHDWLIDVKILCWVETYVGGDGGIAEATAAYELLDEVMDQGHPVLANKSVEAGTWYAEHRSVHPRPRPSGQIR